MVSGHTANDALLKAVAPYDNALQIPLLPNLTNGPAVSGFCTADYWNKAVVDQLAAGIHYNVKTVVLPADDDKRAVIMALAMSFEPGEIVSLKRLGPHCGKRNAASNSTFKNKLRELEAEGWIVIHRGQGYELRAH